MEDVYAAAPAEAAGLGSRFLGGMLVLRWLASGRRYFSRTIGLGVAEPATSEALDDVLDGYERLGISMFLVQSRRCRACTARSTSPTRRSASSWSPTASSTARAGSSPTSRRRPTRWTRRAYEYFSRLGFTRPYIRTHWTRLTDGEYDADLRPK